MASPRKRLSTNVEGDFFVDESCIDCATCRWMAPETFDQGGSMSRVHHQPESEEGVRRALMALVACPTASIGTTEKHDLVPIKASFPAIIEDEVYHCGYHAESSYGAASYLIVREAGNVLIDSPRFSQPLVRRIEELGGIDKMFLTHKDDVVDHAKFHDHFGCERILHADDVTGGTRTIERQLTGTDPVALDDDVLVIPVPGHTKGSACLLYRDRFLFSGDHVAWSQPLQQVYAFRGACWYDWAELKTSMERLAGFTFEHILPGHGWPCRFDGPRMKVEMERCLAWM